MTTSTLIASDYEKFDRSEEHLRIEPSIVISGKLFLGIEDHSLGENTQGTGRYVHIDADKVRDAIDKAVGPRKKDELFLEQSSIYGQVAMHPVFDDCWTADSTPSADAMIEKLDRLDEAEGNGTRAYPARDRDRLLRHIEDLEATLTRRNERHERDQERIRELEAEVFTLREIKDSYEEPKTAREHLDLAWGAAIVPEDGVIRVGEGFLCKTASGIHEAVAAGPQPVLADGKFGIQRRLLEPRPESSKEDSYRKELESKGLAEWEIELLVGAAA